VETQRLKLMKLMTEKRIRALLTAGKGKEQEGTEIGFFFLLS